MTTWDDIVKTALLGTSRSQLPQPTNDQIGQLLTQLNGRSPTYLLLTAAATHSLQHDIGQLPPVTTHLAHNPAPTDDLPRSNPALRNSINATINGRYTQILPELLHHLAHQGQRLPEEFVPNLLRHGIRKTQLHPLIRQTIGKRGQWLAAQNEQWTYAVGHAITIDNPTQTWQTGSHQARLTLLQHLRATNPPHALTLLQTTWDSEDTRQRSDFANALEAGLSAADEPFLEAALDDPSYPVRRRAIELLSRLPTSRLCQRMASRALLLLQLNPSDNPPQFTLTLLDQIDNATQRDGVLPRASAQGMSTAHWRTAQMLSAVPLTRWEEQFSMTPLQLVKTAVSSPHANALIRGWAIAARRQQNIPWCDAILFNANLDIATTQLLELLPILPPPRQQQLLLKLLNNQTHLRALHQHHPILVALQKLPGTWDEPLAHAILERLANDITHDNAGTLLDWKYREAVKRFAYHFPVTLLEEARTTLNNITESRVWQLRIKEFLEIISFRRNMLRNIYETS